MNTKKGLMIVGILLILSIFVLSTLCFADDYPPDSFKGKITTTDTTKVQTSGGKIVGLIRVVGTIASVGMLIVLGIKYLMGSAEERAEYKKTLFPYFIGAILIFGASNLTQVIYTWASKI